MELTMKNGFFEMNEMEMETINGGEWGAALVCVCAGAIGILSGPPAIITGTVAVGCWYVGSALIAVGGVVDAID